MIFCIKTKQNNEAYKISQEFNFFVIYYNIKLTLKANLTLTANYLFVFFSNRI